MFIYRQELKDLAGENLVLLSTLLCRKQAKRHKTANHSEVIRGLVVSFRTSSYGRKWSAGTEFIRSRNSGPWPRGISSDRHCLYSLGPFWHNLSWSLKAGLPKGSRATGCNESETAMHPNRDKPPYRDWTDLGCETGFRTISSLLTSFTGTRTAAFRGGSQST